MCAVKSIIIMLLINKHINIVINNVVESMCEFSRENYSKATRFCFKKKSKIKKDQYKIEATEEKIIFFINKLC